MTNRPQVVLCSEDCQDISSFAPSGDENRLQEDSDARLNSLHLQTFRNYQSANLELESEAVVLTGSNGAGKTNVLEAVSMLSPGRGLRRAHREEVGYFSDHEQADLGRQTPPGRFC